MLSVKTFESAWLKHYFIPQYIQKRNQYKSPIMQQPAIRIHTAWWALSAHRWRRSVRPREKRVGVPSSQPNWATTLPVLACALHISSVVEEPCNINILAAPSLRIPRLLSPHFRGMFSATVVLIGTPSQIPYLMDPRLWCRIPQFYIQTGIMFGLDRNCFSVVFPIHW